MFPDARSQRSLATVWRRGLDDSVVAIMFCIDICIYVLVQALMYPFDHWTLPNCSQLAISSSLSHRGSDSVSVTLTGYPHSRRGPQDISQSVHQNVRLCHG